MRQLPVTQTGNSEIDVTINETVYTLKYNYNTRNQRIYLTLLQDEVIILSGLRLIEGGVPIINYPIPSLDGYQLLIYPNFKGTGFCTLGNFGIDEEFIFILLTPDDVQQIEEAS